MEGEEKRRRGEGEKGVREKQKLHHQKKSIQRERVQAGEETNLKKVGPRLLRMSVKKPVRGKSLERAHIVLGCYASLLFS